MNDVRRPQPPQNPPPVQRLRLRYCKRGRARFASHRDFSRAFERALRRAGVPMSLSSGFNQHVRISYVNASATGAATEADYLEIALAQTCDPEWVRRELSDALPDGMEILAVQEASGASLVESLTASTWRVDVPGVPASILADAVAALLNREELVVERLARGGVRAFDARGPILAAGVDADGALSLALAHGSPLVRPDDVVNALGRVDERFVPSGPSLATRLAQGAWVDGRVVPPF